MKEPMTIKELMAADYGDMQWLVRDLIPASGVTIISGDPKSYKTWLMLDLVRCVAEEKMLFNHFQCTKGHVLIIDEESSLFLLKQRFTLLGVEHDTNIYLLVRDGFKADDPDWMDYIVEFIKEKDIKLVCIDSLVRIHGGDEDKSGQMSAIFTALSKITKLGASVVLTHHNRKSQMNGYSGYNMRGSSDIFAALDCHLAVKVNKELKRITVEQGKLRTAEELEPFKLRINSNEDGVSFEYDGNSEVPEKPKTKKDIACEQIPLFLVEGQKSRTEIIEYLKKNHDCGYNAVHDALHELVESKKIWERDGENNKTIYSLPDPEFEEFGNEEIELDI